MSSKSDVDETRDMIHSEAKFLSNCEPVKPGKLCTYVLPKYNVKIGIKQIFSFQMGETRKKEGVMGLKQVQTVAE